MIFLFVLIICISFTNEVIGQWRRYEPYWIQTMPQAEAIGVDLKRFLDTHCSAVVTFYKNLSILTIKFLESWKKDSLFEFR